MSINLCDTLTCIYVYRLLSSERKKYTTYPAPSSEARAEISNSRHNMTQPIKKKVKINTTIHIMFSQGLKRVLGFVHTSYRTRENRHISPSPSVQLSIIYRKLTNEQINQPTINSNIHRKHGMIAIALQAVRTSCIQYKTVLPVPDCKTRY